MRLTVRHERLVTHSNLDVDEQHPLLDLNGSRVAVCSEFRGRRLTVYRNGDAVYTRPVFYCFLDLKAVDKEGALRER